MIKREVKLRSPQLYSKENYRNTPQVVRPCDEDERGARSERNARCGHTRVKKKMVDKPRERYLDKGWNEREQHNKSGIVEEENQTRTGDSK